MHQQSFKEDSELVDENNNPLTRIQFEIRFKGFQDQLREMTKFTRRSLPPQLDDSELTILDHRPVGSGVGSDVVQGTYLGKTKVLLLVIITTPMLTWSSRRFPSKSFEVWRRRISTSRFVSYSDHCYYVYWQLGCFTQQFNNDLKLWSSVKRHEHLLTFLGWYKCGQEFSLVSEWQSYGNITQ